VFESLEELFIHLLVAAKCVTKKKKSGNKQNKNREKKVL